VLFPQFIFKLPLNPPELSVRPFDGRMKSLELFGDFPGGDPGPVKGDRWPLNRVGRTDGNSGGKPPSGQLP
jgi:hypothetical protein